MELNVGEIPEDDCHIIHRDNQLKNEVQFCFFSFCPFLLFFDFRSIEE